MKRMIVSPAQLKAINEAAISYNLPDISSLSQLPKNNPADITVKFTNSTGTKNVEFDQKDVNTNNFNVDGVSPTDIGSATLKGTNSTGTDANSSLAESHFTKRQVELGRMLEMRRTGKVYSKKQLNEMFFETQENADRLRQGIGGCKLRDIFDAVEEIFPEEIDGVKEAFMNGADLPEYICSIFSNDDINGEKEQAFLERLGI